jgi:hypothetical protein
VLLIALAAAVVARVATPAHQRHTVVSAALACGVERWTVKTLQDRPRLLPARGTTVAHLVSLPRPAVLPSWRLPFERHIYSVLAAVTLVRQEDDSDLHVVIRSGRAHMITEAPNAPICTPRATAVRKRQMQVARSRVRLCAKARVVGVAFWDFRHGQTGVAPNAIELHPILGFACLSGGLAPPPAPPPSGGKCAASYPTVCIPPPPPDLNCADIPYRNFKVLWNVPNPDPHHFDGNHNGIGSSASNSTWPATGAKRRRIA